MEPIYIPSKIDDPPQLIMWSIDELMPTMVGLLLGIMIDQQIICVTVGYLITRQYQKYKDSRPDGYLLHLLYQAGVINLKGRTNINAFITRFYP